MTFTDYDHLEFKNSKKWRWCCIGTHPLGNEDDDEPYLICEDIIEMIAEPEQGEGVEIIRRAEEI